MDSAKTDPKTAVSDDDELNKVLNQGITFTDVASAPQPSAPVAPAMPTQDFSASQTDVLAQPEVQPAAEQPGVDSGVNNQTVTSQPQQDTSTPDQNQPTEPAVPELAMPDLEETPVPEIAGMQDELAAADPEAPEAPTQPNETDGPSAVVERPEESKEEKDKPHVKKGHKNAAHGELDDIKRSAIEELKPLVNKLDLNPEEKFDTLLLIIRSTDDKSLLGPMHDAAQKISDDTRRAQALLDVIKEVDYFNTK